MPELVLRGVPRSLRHDAWWLAAIDGGEAPAPKGHPRQETTASAVRNPIVWPVLVALVALADWLFWNHDAGLSLPVFAAACLMGILGLTPHRLERRDRVRLGVGFGIAALPVAESAQPLSLVFLISASLTIATRLLLGDGAPLPRLPVLTARLALHLPGAAMGEVKDIAASPAARPHWLGLARNWALPVVVGLIFAALLISANPVAERWSIEAGTWLEETLFGSLRPFFWVLIALPLLPLLTAHHLRNQLDRPLPMPAMVVASACPGGGTLFTAASVTRSLFLFNLIFAVQSLMDLVYLWSGAALPDGMTYAEYAHRGAYPLVATALLAGAFALTCRRFAADDRTLRLLLMLWIGQNVLLVISSLYRLDLYIDSYGLTYLRAYAAIWMGLVAVGLASVVWQIARARSNRWLVAANAGLLTATLYACCFINFANLIAAHNLSRGPQDVDLLYICDLGPGAAAALRAAAPSSCAGYPIAEGPELSGWRDWGFRSWRIRRYLAATDPSGLRPNAGENPRH